VFRYVCLALFYSYLTYSILNWGRANKTALLPIVRLQNKAVRTPEYDKTKTTVGLLYSKHKNLNIPDSFKLSVANACAPFAMVDYLTTLISILLRLRQSTNIKRILLLCKNTIYAEWIHTWVSPKIWYNIPENPKTFSPYSFAKQYKKVLLSCQNSCWFSFHMLVTFFNIVLMPLLSLLSFSLSLQLLTTPPVHRHALHALFLCCCCFFAYFTWRRFDTFCYFLLLVKRLQLKANLC